MRIPHEERHERELDVLQAIAQILVTQTGQQQTLEKVLEMLETRLGMFRGTVMLLSSDGTELLTETVGSASSNGGEVRYRRGEGIIGEVLQSGRPFIVPRVSDEPRFQNRVHQREQDLGQISFICIPIALGNEVVGTLSVDLPYDERADLDEDARVLSIVAGMIAHDVKGRRLAKLEREALEAENLRLRDSLGQMLRPENIVGNSKAMRKVYMSIQQVAQADTTVLIRGESGTGKELVAAAIHYASTRADRPFVALNCAALNENLLESELFGHERGAFSGAITTRVGRIEEAEGGTLFLDEIGDLPLSIQVKLLRVLQEREFARLGSNRQKQADVRIITATNRDLEQAVASGVFRQDLYYRVNVFAVDLPPLRDRKEDILLLADYFVERYAGKFNKPVRRISTSAINMMLLYHWPGNVRELENCIQHAVLVAEDEAIHGHDLPPTLQTPESANLGSGTLPTRVAVLECDLITDALKRTNGNVSAAARDLGVTPRILRYKVRKLGIEFPKLFQQHS